MKIVLATLAFFLAHMVEDRLAAEMEDSKQYPVTKVVTLLQDMQAQLSKEAEEDEETYDKMACWCKENDREKTESIKNAETRVADLTTTIESTAAASGRLKTEIASHEADLAKAQKSIDELTAIREKQSSEFNGEEKEMLQSIKALEAAIVVLSKHHSKASLVDERALDQVAQVVRAQMDKHKMMLLGVITPYQKRIMMGAFMQEGVRQPQQSFLTYQPQSSEIFGILRQMKDTFEANLSESQKEELANAKAYAEQKSAKTDEIKAISNSLNEKKTQLAKTDEVNAQSKEDIQDTQNSLSIDDKFLIDLKERCAVTDQEWELRQKARQEELTAIQEAISILSNDVARDTFSKTFNAGAAASLLQKKAIARHSHARAEAARVLQAVATKVSSPELSSLAMSAQLDAFTKVKEAIDKMVKQLGEEKAAEITQKDFCIEKLNENTLLAEKETRQKTDSEMKISTLKSTISELTATLETLHKEIAEMNKQIKRAGEDRELANKDFQGTIADQRETQKLLSKAISVLEHIYVKKAPQKLELTVVKSTVAAQPPPPPGFNDYSKNAGGGGAVALLTQILGDAKVMEAEAVKDEQAEQQSYEKFVKDNNAAIASKQTAIINKSQDKANAEQDLGTAKTDLDEQSTQLQSLANAKHDLNLQCDFLMKNFDLRQQARDEEIEALKQAKAILSGMQTDSGLE